MISVRAAFDSRSNSIGFLRWAMAFMVIFSHAGPIAGFYGGKDLGTQLSSEQSLGGVAVCGFFFLSGFLITRSKMRPISTLRFLWHRVLRIFPGWFLALATTAYLLAPIAWVREHGSLNGYWNATFDSPLTYFVKNMTLLLRQINIAGMGESTPLFQDTGIKDWNGSAWTLAYEFGAYLLVALLGVVGALAARMVAGIVAGAIILLAMVQWSAIGDISKIWDGFADGRVLLLMAPFAFGMLFSLYGDRIPLDGRLAALCAVIAVFTYVRHGWLLLGQYAFCYLLMWFAIRVRAVRNWDRPGDFSYGIYIIGWPMMLFATYFGLERAGWLVYHLVVIVAVHVYAFASWHLIEQPAMRLKGWTPRPVGWLMTRTAPLTERLRSRVGPTAVTAASERGS